jgi:hypothetical protein|uniref:Uncharacterized protein n=1 Tax=Leclercia adecarboxylata TaxID=83655 RepID=A0A7D5JMT5_9ENTR|nr:hypothetical protein [Leclercia adecarboxylata]
MEVIPDINAGYRSDYQRPGTGSVSLQDVCPEKEYISGYFSGALNILLQEVESRPAKLPKESELMGNCREPHYILSVEAVEYLRRKG